MPTTSSQSSTAVAREPRSTRPTTPSACAVEDPEPATSVTQRIRLLCRWLHYWMSTSSLQPGGSGLNPRTSIWSGGTQGVTPASISYYGKPRD